MGKLIDLFTKREVPVEEVDSDFVQDFIENHLGEFINATRGLSEADNAEDLEAFMRDIRALVLAWPNPDART